MKILLVLASLGIACAQVTILPSTASPQRGQPVTITANYGAIGSIAALQMDIAPVTGLTFTATSGTKLAPAAKILSCGSVVVGTGIGNYRCIVSGNTTSALQAGDQIVYSFVVPALQHLGPLAINFSNIIGATPAGMDAGLPNTASVNLTVMPKKYDLNGDGVIDLSDAKIALDQAMGTVACTAGDTDGDKACTAIDIVLILFNLGK